MRKDFLAKSDLFHVMLAFKVSIDYGTKVVFGSLNNKHCFEDGSLVFQGESDGLTMD
jgi:hypothetical protein